MYNDKITINGEKITINVKHDEIWLSAHEIAYLLDCFVAKITSNIRSIFKTDVLNEKVVLRTHYYDNGNSVEQYNLEMIIALSFRVKSKNAEVFRHWLIRKTTCNTAGTKIVMSKDLTFSLN